MQVVSTAGLPYASVVWGNGSQGWVLTLVCKATFTLTPGLSPLAEAQEEIARADEHWNDDVSRSLRVPSDLLPFKPRADVLVVGSACAPGPAPVRMLTARVVVGEVDKSVEVHADRWFSADGSLITGSLFKRMPLVYERAGGGPDTTNPVGLRPATPDSLGRVRVPNLTWPGAPPRAAGDFVEPVGLGPLSPSWPSRREKLGALARAGLPEQWTDAPLPEGFDFRYFNAAPADQQTDYLPSGARLVLENLLPASGRFVTNLASVQPFARVEGRGGAPVAMRADTLWIDTDRLLCTVTFRAQIPLTRRDEAGEIKLWTDSPSPAGEPPSRPTPEPSSALPASQSAAPSAAAERPRDTPPTGAPKARAPYGPVPGARQLTQELIYNPADPNLWSRPQGQALPFGNTPVPAPLVPAPVAPPAPPPTAPAPVSPASPPTFFGHLGPLPPAGPASVPPPASTAISASPPQAPPPPSWAPSPPPWEPSPAAPWSAPVQEPRAGVSSGLGGGPRSGLSIGLSSTSSDVGRPLSLSSTSSDVGRPLSLSSTSSDVGRPASHSSPDLGPLALPPAPAEPPTPPSPSPPAVAPAPRRPISEYVEILWFDDTAARRVRQEPGWLAAIRGARKTSEWIVGEEPEEPSQAIQDKRDVQRAMGRVPAVDAAGIARVMEEAVNEDGIFEQPIVLVTGDLVMSFEPLDTLRATLTIATQLAGGDKRLKEALDAAGEIVAGPRGALPPLVDGALTRVRQAFALANRSLAPDYLETTVTRILTEDRSYLRRRLFGGQHIGGLLTLAPGNPPLPTYMPEALAEKLPLFPRLRVRAIAEPHAPQDPSDPEPFALRILALGRVTTIGAPSASKRDKERA